MRVFSLMPSIKHLMVRSLDVHLEQMFGRAGRTTDWEMTFRIGHSLRHQQSRFDWAQRILSTLSAFP